MKRDRRDDDLRRARGRRHRRRRRAESSRRRRREKWFCRRHRAQIYLLLGEGTATDVIKLFCAVFYTKLARFNLRKNLTCDNSWMKNLLAVLESTWNLAY